MATSSIIAHYDIEEAMEHLYDVTILGRKTILTTLTKHPEAVTQWINDVKPDQNTHPFRYVGFGAQFYTNDNYTRCVGAVQFCVGSRCLVFQLDHSSWPCPPSLNQFLGDYNNSFFGIDIEYAMEQLRKQYPFEAFVQSMDVNGTAAERYERPDLAEVNPTVLALTALGVDLDMPDPEPDWGRPTKLSDDQVHYACIVAYLNLEIGRWLSNYEL